MTAVQIGDKVTINGVTGDVIGLSDLMIVIERVGKDGATERFTYPKTGVNIEPAEKPQPTVDEVALLRGDATVPLVETEDVEPASITAPDDDDEPAPAKK